MCGKGWVVKGYSAFSRDSAILEGYAERGVVVLLQWLWEWKGSVQREERAPPLRKARGIVRFWRVMWGEGLLRNPSGSRPNFFRRQHLTFDKGGKCDGAKQGIVRFWKVMRREGLLSFCNGCGGWQY